MSEYESLLQVLQSTQSKLQTENNDLSNQLDAAESKNGTLSKTNNTLSSQVDDLKGELDSESNVSRVFGCECVRHRYDDNSLQSDAVWQHVLHCFTATIDQYLLYILTSYCKLGNDL